MPSGRRGHNRGTGDFGADLPDAAWPAVIRRMRCQAQAFACCPWIKYRCIVAHCLARRPIPIMKNSPRPASGPSFHAGALLLASFTLLAGCGGGGGGGGAVKKTCVDTAQGCLEKEAYNAAVLDAAEEIRTSPGFENRWGLAEIRLAEAWGHLRTVRGSEQPGLGITVGVLDTGIDLDHPTFQEGAAAGLVTEEFLSGATNETGRAMAFP